MRKFDMTFSGKLEASRIDSDGKAKKTRSILGGIGKSKQRGMS